MSMCFILMFVIEFNYSRLIQHEMLEKPVTYMLLGVDYFKVHRRHFGRLLLGLGPCSFIIECYKEVRRALYD